MKKWQQKKLEESCLHKAGIWYGIDITIDQQVAAIL